MMEGIHNAMVRPTGKLPEQPLQFSPQALGRLAKVEPGVVEFLESRGKAPVDLADLLAYCMELHEPQGTNSLEPRGLLAGYRVEKISRRVSIGRLLKGVGLGIGALGAYSVPSSARRTVKDELGEIGPKVMKAVEDAQSGISRSITDFKTSNADAISQLGEDMKVHFNQALDRLANNLDPSRPVENIDGILQRLREGRQAITDWIWDNATSLGDAAKKLLDAFLKLIDDISDVLRKMWENIVGVVGPDAIREHWKHAFQNFLWGIPPAVFRDIAGLVRG